MSVKDKSYIIRLFLLLFADAAAVYLSSFLALLIRFEFQISKIETKSIDMVYRYLLFNFICTAIVFAFFHLYTSLWKYASVQEICNVAFAVVVAGVVQYLGTKALQIVLPRSYYVLWILLMMLLEICIRFGYRFFRFFRNEYGSVRSADANVMIIGAGDAGAAILKEMRLSKFVTQQVRCFIDDSPAKQGKYIQGCPVVGGRERLVEMAEKYAIEKIIIAIPTASKRELRELVELCQQTGCEIHILPGTYQIINGEVSVSQLREVSIDDLLGRDQIQVNLMEIMGDIKGRTVLVTGGGGSIGQELCRQLATHQPKKLIIFDIYENNAYDIQQELLSKHKELNLETIIGSVRDSRKIFQIFEQFQPDYVYHAAAHKHVPLMEDSPCEAVKNNVIGTYKTAFAAMTHGCKRFVLISTDKAVNPTNIMGASKRLCEMVIQAFDAKIKEGRAADIPQLFTHLMKDDEISNRVQIELAKTKTEFVAVRFGNVLGSNGSVIPLFKKQIAKGGPVTVTHPDIIRYFMTIPEAVSLVLQAGAYAGGGEIFVLDMGEPVKIVDLAKNLIRCSGYQPDVDIPIVYTGLRPGEKLYEEKLMSEEGLKKTKNDLIHIGSPIPFDIEQFLVQLGKLMEAAYKNRENIRELVGEMVGTYHPEE